MTSDLEPILTILKNLQDQVATMQVSISKIEERLDTIYHNRTSVPDNPLFASQPLIETLKAIETFEDANQRGVLAKELVTLRNLAAPTIYDHLLQLSESSLIFWQRGRELGLDPCNAKFYSISQRKEVLDLSTILTLPDEEMSFIAQLIFGTNDAGITLNALINQVVAMKDDKNSIWASKSPKDIKNRVEEVCHVLLQRVLIYKRQQLGEEYYFAKKNI